MALLTWREATTEDKTRLEQFRCTAAPRKMKRPPWHEMHPRKWELALQREIHTLNPRCNDRRTVLLGFGPRGRLAAVSVAELLSNASEVVLECVAVSIHRRAKGGSGLGDEAVQRAIDWATGKADAAAFDAVLIIAKTHPANDLGRALLTRNGFGLRPGVEDPKAVWYQQQIVL